MTLKNIFGYTFIFLHHLVIPILYLYILFFNYNFILNLIIVLLSFSVIFFWYIFNDCILLPFESYFINKEIKKTFYDNRKEIIFKIMDTKFVIFESVIYSPYTYTYLIFILIGFFKLYYIYNKSMNNCKKKM
jgi:hypothetical protein